MSEIEAWLRDKVLGFAQLSRAELDAINGFAFLWGLFEGRVFPNGAGATAICDAVQRWHDEGLLNAAEFEEEIGYFCARYSENGQHSPRFSRLELRRNDKPELVAAVVAGATNDPVERVCAMLIIIYRFRNNLFHGLKWQYRLAGQLDNFRTANGVLTKLLLRHGRLSDEA
ncbi:hypothetical protein FHS96_005557 [Sphingomonas zeicaulis]|uniref:hypothetical protein n=1 Tax=Sphingomonas zeicaulis TaxID=1632740 RepID=UPI003D25BD3A